MCEEERYYLKRITFIYCQDPFDQKKGTNIQEYHKQIMTFIKIYVVDDFTKEQNMPIIIAQQRFGRGGFPEYIHEIRFDFEKAVKGKELGKDTVLEFGKHTIDKLCDFLKAFKHLNNGHKTRPIAYWPPKGSENEIMMFGEVNEHGERPLVSRFHVPVHSRQQSQVFTQNFINPMFPTMFRDIPQFMKSSSKDEEEDE